MECAAKGCIHHGSKISEDELPENVSFHLFPKNPTLRAKWIKQMNQDDFKPVPTSALCSMHFIKEYFVTDAQGVQHLKADAIPTEFEFDSMESMETSADGDDVIRCCAYKCTNVYSEDSPITFHPFPLDQPQLCDQWLLAMNVTQVAAQQAVLCSEHFDESCFVEGDNGERLIMADAVPSIFLYADEPENVDEGDTPMALSIETGGLKYELTEASVELVQKHDEVVSTLNEETQRLMDLVRQRAKLEKEKKDIDYLLRSVLNSTAPDRGKLKDLRTIIRGVDDVVQSIVVDCLAPCIALSQDSQEMQE